MGASGARRLFICLQSLMNIFQALLCLSAAFLSADFTLGLAFRIASVIPFWVISILIPYEKVLVDGLRYHLYIKVLSSFSSLPNLWYLDAQNR